jgi:fluoride exporter
MQAILLVGVGGAVGSLARYWMTLISAQLVGETFPWGTLAINVIGSFVIGAVAALTGGDGALAGNMSLRLLVMVGICGGFTTFSSFSLQTFLLLREGALLWAAAYVAGSVLICLAGTAAGIALFTRS